MRIDLHSTMQAMVPNTRSAPLVPPSVLSLQCQNVPELDFGEKWEFRFSTRLACPACPAVLLLFRSPNGMSASRHGLDRLQGVYQLPGRRTNGEGQQTNNPVIKPPLHQSSVCRSTSALPHFNSSGPTVGFLPHPPPLPSTVPGMSMGPYSATAAMTRYTWT